MRGILPKQYDLGQARLRTNGLAVAGVGGQTGENLALSFGICGLMGRGLTQIIADQTGR